MHYLIKLTFFAATITYLTIHPSQTTFPAVPTLVTCITINCPCGNGFFKNGTQAYKAHYELLFRAKNKKKYQREQCSVCLRTVANQTKHVEGKINRYVHDVITSQNFHIAEWCINSAPSEKNEPIYYLSPVETSPEQQEPALDHEILSLSPLLPHFSDLDTQNALEDQNVSGLLD